MKKIKHIILSLAVITGLLGLVNMQTAFAANAPGPSSGSRCTNGSFLTFPVWYNGLAQDSVTCTPKITALDDIWKIVLNLLEILLQASGYIATGFIVWGGFKYMKAQGNPQNIASAKSTIMDASIGLGIALTSVAIVKFVSGLF